MSVINNIKFILCTLLIGSTLLVNIADARTLLKNICHVKGQEEITLQGRGLVVGLNGTGDGSKSMTTIRAVAQTLALMGAPIGGGDANSKAALKELQALDPKNIAEVFIRVTVPKDGAVRGEALDVEVSAIRAKSLKGGSLLMTPLLGPVPEKSAKDRTIFAHAFGKIELEEFEGKAVSETIGVINSGARMKIDLQPTYVEDGKITLVIDKNHASWAVAAGITDLINRLLNSLGDTNQGTQRANEVEARAIGPKLIVIPIPKSYLADPKKKRPEATTSFVREVLSLQIHEPSVEARVVVNRRTGAIVISGDIEVGTVIIKHKSITVSSGTESRRSFMMIDPNNRDAKIGESTTQLSSLLKALNAVEVPVKDIISILRALERDGKLHGKLIFQ